MRELRLSVNGRAVQARVEPRTTLADAIREQALLTGTHLGCEHGVCGACTVLLDGVAVRSCLLLAVQAEGAEVTTVEALASGGELHPLQRALHLRHGLQCGFCTAGILMSLAELWPRRGEVTRDEIIDCLGGHLCRCTGYVGIVRAAEDAFGLAPEETG
ncbi:MAG TPA: (2Fe-2S)-binding protein [Candidatus Dormibacteraeota bacterium]|jgi:aerobic-type carbon monoxide dehydrogenase small subunit (CoxS/CutS family)|nr:(2Fe-2S)-binding protein [Candidatus Dormibacteraeota bacterium]